MKAIRLHKRGSTEQLVYEDAPEPALQPGDALVRVFACSITSTELTWNETYTNQAGASRLPAIPSHEFSGVVQSAPATEAEIKPGDAVYALSDFSRDGAAADYIAIRAADLARKPKNLSFVQAAAVPLAALTAWQALFEHAKVSQGQRVLIHGGAGGVGTYAVELAHHAGARVITTARQRNESFVRGLGADEFSDYSVLPFEDEVRDADVVLDTVGGDTLNRSWRVLRPGGTLVSIVEPIPAQKPAEYGVRGVYFIVEPNRAQLMEIARLIEAGEIHPVIEATFPLADTRQAFERGLQGHNRGKIVLEVASQSAAAHI